VQYLPIEGLAAFNKATADLLLGADNPAIKQQRVCSWFRKYRSFEGHCDFLGAIFFFYFLLTLFSCI